MNYDLIVKVLFGGHYYLILYVLKVFQIMILYKQLAHNLKFFILILFQLLAILILLKLLFFLFFQLQFQILENFTKFSKQCLIKYFSYLGVSILVNLNYMFCKDFIESFNLCVILILIFNLIVVILSYLLKLIKVLQYLLNLNFQFVI